MRIWHKLTNNIFFSIAETLAACAVSKSSGVWFRQAPQVTEELLDEDLPL